MSLWRSGERAAGVVLYGNPGDSSLQSGAEGVLCLLIRAGQTEEDGIGRLDAQVADHFECDS